ncbi:MAG TPA: hypothetical protein PLV78_13860, partial [Deltaproteobacteria bacterium]|nr:hypothetical protein [Deltaproteobacteria bacterium]
GCPFFGSVSLGKQRNEQYYYNDKTDKFYRKRFEEIDIGNSSGVKDEAGGLRNRKGPTAKGQPLTCVW